MLLIPYLFSLCLVYPSLPIILHLSVILLSYIGFWYFSFEKHYIRPLISTCIRRFRHVVLENITDYICPFLICRRERDHSEAERSKNIQKISELQEHIQEKESQLSELQEQVSFPLFL